MLLDLKPWEIVSHKIKDMKLLDVVYPDSPSSSVFWITIVLIALMACLFFVWKEWKKNISKKMPR